MADTSSSIKDDRAHRSVRPLVLVWLPLCCLLLNVSCSQVDDDDDTCVDKTWYRDGDGDGFGLAGSSQTSCVAAAGYVKEPGDCLDIDPATHPAAAEQCDGVDNDCDGTVDEGLEVVAGYADADADGYGDATGPVAHHCALTPGAVANALDCDDADPGIHPDADDPVCDGVDGDCDGEGGGVVAAVLDGQEWPTIATAIEAAADGDTVFVCPGIHHERLELPGARQLSLESWSGTAVDTVVDGGNSHTLLVIPAGSSVQVANLAFRNGLAESLFSLDAGPTGGAIAAMDSELTVSGCEFSGNIAAGGDGYGGAIAYVTAESLVPVQLTVDRSAFDQNAADGGGGAIWSYGMADYAVELSDSRFEGNAANDGGALYLKAFEAHIDVWLEDCDVYSNLAFSDAGGIAVDGTKSIDVSIQSSLIESNGSGENSAALDVDGHEDTVVEVSTTTISGNTAAAVHLEGWAGSVATFTDVDIRDNTATMDLPAGLRLRGEVAAFLYGGSVAANLGGGCEMEDQTSLHSVGVDWGEGEDDNLHYDVLADRSSYWFTTGEIFSCDAFQGLCH
jgi:hypothetical protein